MQTKCEVGKLKKGVSHTEDLESMWSYHLRTYTWHCTVCSVWLWNPMDCSPSGSSVHGIFPAILERAAISSSGDLAHTGTEPVSLALAGRFFTTLSHLESPRTYRHKEENQYTEMIAKAWQEGHSSRPLWSLQDVIMPLWILWGYQSLKLPQDLKTKAAWNFSLFLWKRAPKLFCFLKLWHIHAY